LVDDAPVFNSTKAGKGIDLEKRNRFKELTV
jgi:hypothetical protein